MNKHRGETKIKLGGKDYTLSPSYEALVSIEEDLDAGLLEILNRIRVGNYRINDLATIVTHGMHAAGEKRATVSGNAKMIVEAGMLDCVQVVVDFLSLGITGGVEPGKPAGESQQPPSPIENSSDGQ